MTSVDLGHDWLLPNGQRALLCWYPFSGELVLHKPSGPPGRNNEVLAVITDETELRRRLDGYEHHAYTRGGLGWLAGQLDGAR
jgi:hypothetical protein